MPVRLRLGIRARHSGREAVVKALVNTGFMSDSPDIAIPTALAQNLSLWPLREGEAVVVFLEFS